MTFPINSIWKYKNYSGEWEFVRVLSAVEIRQGVGSVIVIEKEGYRFPIGLGMLDAVTEVERFVWELKLPR